MKNSSLALVFIASLIAACGSEVSADSDSTGNGGDSGLTPPGNGNDGNGGTSNAAEPQPDGGGAGGDQDSGTGGGDQDGGAGGGDTDGGSGGGDQDGGSGGGQTDGGDTCTPHACVLTQGYYKIHTVDWTGPSLNLGGVSYTQQEWVGLLKLSPQGDDSVILAKQLIAALLNGGACDPNAAATVQAAQDWMAANKDQDGRLPYGTMCVNQSDPGCTAWSLGQTLDAYNKGNSGTPHCN